jgi:penicillin-binding protein 1C
LTEREDTGTGEIITSVDLVLQRQVQQLLALHLQQLVVQGAHEGAVLVVENRSRMVKAYVANQGARSQAPYLDAIVAKRPAGSTLKPFLYAAAFEQNILSPDSLLEDAPIRVPLPSGTYRPDNYDHSFHGLVSAAESLGSSLNIPAVRTLDLVGVPLFAEVLTQFGLPLAHQYHHYGLSLALGSLEVSLENLVRAYVGLAQGGVMGPLCLTPECSSKGTRVLSSKVANSITAILRDNRFRARTFGLHSSLQLSVPAAVKTGTSRDIRDGWCIGYTDAYTVAVWIGNFDNAPMLDASGAKSAAPLWADVMHLLESGSSAEKPRFLEPRTQSQHPTAAPPHITYPPPGAVLALDPTLPIARQKLVLQIEGELAGTSVQIDATPPLPAAEGLLWNPVAGLHTIQLLDKRGQVLDRVAFSVQPQ